LDPLPIAAVHPEDFCVAFFAGFFSAIVPLTSARAFKNVCEAKGDLIQFQEATSFQFNEYRSIELSIAEPIASFFPPEYDNRLDFVRVQFVPVIQDWWSAPSVGYLNDRRFVVELDRQADSRRRQSPVFDKHNGMVDLNPRHHRRPVSTRDEENASREWQRV